MGVYVFDSLSLSTPSARIVIDRLVCRAYVSKRLVEQLHQLSSNPANFNQEFPCLVPFELPIGTYKLIASFNNNRPFPFVRFAKGNHYINGRCWKVGNRWVIEFGIGKYTHMSRDSAREMGQDEPWLHSATLNDIQRELHELITLFPDYWVYSMEIACHSSLVLTPRWLQRLDDQKSSTNFTYAEKASDRKKSKISVERSGSRYKHHKTFHWNFYHLPSRVNAKGGASYGNTNFEYTVWYHFLQKKFGVKHLQDLEYYKTFEIWASLATKAGFNRQVGTRADKRWENLIQEVRIETLKLQKSIQ